MTAPSRSAPADPQDLLAGLGRSWLWPLSFGILTLLAGIVMLAWPEETVRVVAIIIGLLAGWIASMILNRHHGLIVNLIIGLVGALIGSWLAGMFHIVLPLSPFWADLCVSVAGAVILLLILSLFRRRP